MPRPTLTLAVTLLCACCKAKDTPRPDATPTASASAPAPTPTKEPSLVDKLKATVLLKDALDLTQPLMEDTQDKPDKGAALLALWMADHPSWSAIQRLPDTSHARVLKDSEAERGKKICVSGTIVQIAKEQGTKVYSGTLGTPDQKIYFYIAVASTGDLLENSPAKFCGVVTGRFSYSNVTGGTTHAVRLVGLFDLPENRKL